MPRSAWLAMVAFLLATAGCATFSPDLLDPTSEAVQSRLLPLSVGIAGENVVREEAVRSVSVQSQFATVFERELEQNVFLVDRDRWGYIELRVTYDESSWTLASVGVFALNLVTAAVPMLLGVPLPLLRTVQAEVVVFDSRKVRVRSYTYTAGAVYGDSLYRGGIAYRRAGVVAVKEIIRQFKLDVSEDSESLNQVLRSVGAI